MSLLLPLSLAFIMFSMGLALVVSDFLRVFTQPRAMLFGLCSQMLVLPSVAFILAYLWSLPPALAVGLIVLAASPGGITSNLLTQVAGGDSALSVSLTAVTSLAGVITLPVLVNLGLHWFSGTSELVVLSVGNMVVGLVLISTLPLVLGMGLRYYRPTWAAKIQSGARKLALLLFVLIVVATFMGQWGSIDAHFASAGPAVILLNLTTMGLAFFGSWVLRLGRRQGIAIGLECGLQNAAMGIFVAGTLLADSEMVIPSIIYALVMNISAAAVILVNKEPAQDFLLSR